MDIFTYQEGGVLPYMGMVGRFCGDDSHFSDFQSNFIPILYLNSIWLTPLSAKKSACLYQI